MSIPAIVILQTVTPSTDKTDPIERYASDAYICAMYEVEDMLKAPSTADFPSGRSHYDARVLKNYDDVYEFLISSYVDAENSFGAMIRTEYDCTVRITPVEAKCSALCNFK